MTETTYKIGEAAALLNLKTYVLRFWELEFPQLTPLRTEKGQRLYTEAHVALLRRIRHLLHERGLTIEGARRVLREESHSGQSGTAYGAPADTPSAAKAAAASDGPAPGGTKTPSIFSGLGHDELQHLKTELESVRTLLTAISPKPE